MCLMRNVRLEKNREKSFIIKVSERPDVRHALGSIFHRFKSFICLCPFLLMGIGCAEVSLELQKEEPEAAVQSKDSFCIVEPYEIDAVLKIIFVVDISGSNTSNDPNGSKRADNIDQFVQSLEDGEGEYQYGLILFDDRATPSFFEPNRTRFTENPEEFYKSTDWIRRASANGGTTYGVALGAAQAAIEDDMNKFPDQRNLYTVLFISDGEPGDDPFAGVDDLLEASPGNIYLSTAYYGSHGNDAINILQDMADAGNGNFVNFEDGEHWNLDDLLVESEVIPWGLKQLLVYNLNAGFCFDGKIDVDSDVDGMCDRDELLMNRRYAQELEEEGVLFDPANRFSFGDGYGDFFHWLRFKYREYDYTLVACDDKSDEDFDLLTACEEKEIKTQRGEDLLRGDPKSFDSDKDGLLDGIETFVYFASQNTGRSTRYTAALDPNNILDNLDGEGSVLDQIKEHRNPWFKDSEVQSYDTVVDSSMSKDNDCYDFSQSVLPVYETLEVKAGNTLPGLEHRARENSVLLYYIQTLQSFPQEQGILKYSVQKIKWGQLSLGLEFKERLFDEYVPPDMQGY